MLTSDRAARMCPACAEDGYVYDSRVMPDGAIRRRRRCPMCGTKWITEETFLRLGRKWIGEEMFDGTAQPLRSRRPKEDKEGSR